MIPAIQNFTCVLEKKTRLTDDVFEFVFQLNDEKKIDFKSGQFMMLSVPVLGSFAQKRAYSIASPSYNKNSLGFCIKLVEGGLASTYLSKLNLGESVALQGPFGRFYVDMENKKDLLFVATGTGVAPFYGILLDLFAQNYEQKIELYMGLRSEKDIFYKDLFEDLQKKHSNFQFYLTLSRPSDGYLGLKGRVTDHVEINKYNPSSTEIYLCGSGAMVTEIRTNFLHNDFAKENIHEELFHI